VAEAKNQNDLEVHVNPKYESKLSYGIPILEGTMKEFKGV
jgi:hypothetical protein